MKVCILIPHYHEDAKSEWRLNQCLRSIKEFEPGLLQHTMILDDASPFPGKGGFYSAFQRRYGCQVMFKMRKTTEEENLNCGLKLARKYGYDFAAVIASDVELKTGFLPQADVLFSVHPTLAVIGARIYAQDGRLDHEGYTLKPDRTIDVHGRDTFDPTHGAAFMAGVSGAFHIVRLANCETYTSTDLAFCLKAWERGQCVYYAHDIVAVRCKRSVPKLGIEIFDVELILDRLNPNRRAESHQAPSSC